MDKGYYFVSCLRKKAVTPVIEPEYYTRLVKKLMNYCLGSENVKVEKKYSVFYLNFFLFFICILISIIIFFLNDHEGYKLLFTQPILFGFVFILLFSKILRGNSRLFFVILTGISFIRYVLLPLFIVISGYYGGRSSIEPKSESYIMAILLINYELIVAAIFIAIMEKRRLNIPNNFSTLKLNFNNKDIVYYLVIIFSFFSIILFPSIQKSISFIVPSTQEIDLSFIENLILYFVIVSKQLLFIIITKKLYSLYIKTNNRNIIALNFIVGLFNILIYFGTNRSDIVISAFVTFILLYKLYGRIVRKYLYMGAIILTSVVILVTNYREHASIVEKPDFFTENADLFQVYTGGPYNVAIALETKEYFPEANHPSVLFFDIFRPMIGINILVKDLPFQYSNIYFNQRIWLDVDRRSQILPMIGQGNLYFGYLFSPLFSIIFISIFYFLERKTLLTKNIEIYYFLNLAMMRLGFFMGQNTMNMINDMSMNLVLFLFIFFINKIVKNSIR